MNLKLTPTERTYILETALAWLAAMGMLIYGLAKGMQFNGAAFSDKTIAELTGMQLMWAFYAYSKAFALVIGALEVAGGLLLLFPRTRILGGLLCTTVLANIILQDIFYGVHMGALKAALTYQLAILGIFYLRRAAIRQALRQITARLGSSPRGRRSWLLLILAFLLFAMLRTLEYAFTIAL